MFSIMSFGLISCTVIFTILIYFKILPAQDILNSGVLIFISVIFGIPYLIAILKYVDKEPMIIIDSKGISIRKSGLPFSALQQIDWNDIKGYKAQVDRPRFAKFGETMFLVITRKSTNKKYSVDLLDVNTDIDEILTAIEKYLKRHNQTDQN